MLLKAGQSCLLWGVTFYPHVNAVFVVLNKSPVTSMVNSFAIVLKSRDSVKKRGKVTSGEQTTS